jgi:hypothetical protein
LTVHRRQGWALFNGHGLPGFFPPPAVGVGNNLAKLAGCVALGA